MPAASRLTDLWVGICCCHVDPPCIPMSGFIITGSSDAYTNSLRQARVTDLTIGFCGDTGHIITGSPNDYTNNLYRARIGDIVVGCNIGVVVTGSPNKYINGGGGSLLDKTFGLKEKIKPMAVTISQEGIVVKHTEVDFGNVDDEETNDDGLNIFPALPVGATPTPEQINISQQLDVSPTEVLAEDATANVTAITPPTSCLSVPDPPPDNFQLTDNFNLGEVSSRTAVSKWTVISQHGLSVSDIVCNLQAWCENIGEEVGDHIGGRQKIMITSGFRVGASTSQHERGQATDMQFPSLTNHEIYELAIWIRDNLPYDQLILEYGGNRPWIHSSFNRAGNRSPAAFNKFGTRDYPGHYVWGNLLYME
jgi:hypothetical protein